MPAVKFEKKVNIEEQVSAVSAAHCAQEIDRKYCASDSDQIGVFILYLLFSRRAVSALWREMMGCFIPLHNDLKLTEQCEWIC